MEYFGLKAGERPQRITMKGDLPWSIPYPTVKVKSREFVVGAMVDVDGREQIHKQIGLSEH